MGPRTWGQSGTITFRTKDWSMLAQLSTLIHRHWLARRPERASDCWSTRTIPRVAFHLKRCGTRGRIVSLRYCSRWDVFRVNEFGLCIHLAHVSPHSHRDQCTQPTSSTRVSTNVTHIADMVDTSTASARGDQEQRGKERGERSAPGSYCESWEGPDLGICSCPVAWRDGDGRAFGDRVKGTGFAPRPPPWRIPSGTRSRNRPAVPDPKQVLASGRNTSPSPDRHEGLRLWWPSPRGRVSLRREGASEGALDGSLRHGLLLGSALPPALFCPRQRKAAQSHVAEDRKSRPWRPRDGMAVEEAGLRPPRFSRRGLK